MNDFRASRYRSYLRHRERQTTLTDSIPKVQSILDTYVKARHGEVNPTQVILWKRVFLATVAVAGLISGLIYLLGAGVFLTAISCGTLVTLTVLGVRALVLWRKSGRK